MVLWLMQSCATKRLKTPARICDKDINGYLYSPQKSQLSKFQKTFPAPGITINISSSSSWKRSVAWIMVRLSSIKA